MPPVWGSGKGCLDLSGGGFSSRVWRESGASTINYMCAQVLGGAQNMLDESHDRVYSDYFWQWRTQLLRVWSALLFPNACARAR
eukprot:1151611-Pelagomonas_calceolata.AAC.8